MGRQIVAVVLAGLVLTVAALSGATDKHGASSLRRETDRQVAKPSGERHLDEPIVARHLQHYVELLRVSVPASAHRLQEHLHEWLQPLSAAAVITTVALQLSPMPSTLEIRRNQDVLRYDGYPYFAVLAGATQWCIYGSYAAWVSGEKAFFTMVAANGPGLLFGIFYISSFFRYVRAEDPRNPALQRFLHIGAGVLFVEFGACLVLGSGAVFWLGLLGAFGSAQIACSPFKTLPEVVRTKSCGFGVANNDCWVWLPNLIGVLAACGQLFFVGLYREQGSLKGSRGTNDIKVNGSDYGSIL